MKKKIINYPAIIIFLMIVVVGLGYLFFDYKYNYIDDVNLNKSLTLYCQVEANVESDMCQDFFYIFLLMKLHYLLEKIN